MAPNKGLGKGLGALQVFNERQLHRLFVVRFNDDDGHLA